MGVNTYEFTQKRMKLNGLYTVASKEVNCQWMSRPQSNLTVTLFEDKCLLLVLTLNLVPILGTSTLYTCLKRFNYTIEHLYNIILSSNLVRHSWRGVLNTTLCDKVCQWHVAGLWFSLGTQVSSSNKTDCHDMTEILLKVVSNTPRHEQDSNSQL